MQIDGKMIAAILVGFLIFGGGGCGGGTTGTQQPRPYMGDQITNQIQDANARFDAANLPSQCGEGGCAPGEKPERKSFRKCEQEGTCP